MLRRAASSLSKRLAKASRSSRTHAASTTCGPRPSSFFFSGFCSALASPTVEELLSTQAQKFESLLLEMFVELARGDASTESLQAAAKVASLLESLGDVRCRFGDHPLTTEVNATIESPSRASCVSPPHWERREGKQHVEIQKPKSNLMGTFSTTC